MIDTVHSFHAPIYSLPRSKRLPPSFYWGLGFAILLHLVLLFYLFQQNFNVSLPVERSDATDKIEGFVQMDHPKPAQVDPPKNRIIVHEPLKDAPQTVEKTPIDPTANKGPEADTTKTPPMISNGSGGAGAVGTQATVTGPVYVEAKWTRFPDGSAFSSYYPPRAAESEIEGAASVECTVLDQAGRVSCAVLSESPRTMGFGQATVRMVQDKGRVDTSAGDVKIGSVLRLSVKWTLN